MPDTATGATETLEIQDIVADLQEEIRRHRVALGASGDATQKDPLSAVRQHQWINSHLPIGWPVMPKGIRPKLVAYAQKVVRRLLRWYIDPIVEQQNACNAAVARTLESLQAASILRSPEPLGLLERRGAPSGDQDHIPATPDGEVGRCVLGDENRGGTPAIERLRDYDDLFAELREGQNEGRCPIGPILVVGSDLGRFVAHLDDMGLDAHGYEVGSVSIAATELVEEDVRCGDLLASLASRPVGSLAAIILTHLAELLGTDGLVNLLQVAHNKLAPGGLFVVETVNALCVSALLTAHLRDPGLRTPLPPAIARALVEQAGFTDVEVRFLRPVACPTCLEPLPDSVGQWTQVAKRNIDRLNLTLYGPEDYAVIARRRGD